MLAAERGVHRDTLGRLKLSREYGPGADHLGLAEGSIPGSNPLDRVLAGEGSGSGQRLKDDSMRLRYRCNEEGAWSGGLRKMLPDGSVPEGSALRERAGLRIEDECAQEHCREVAGMKVNKNGRW